MSINLGEPDNLKKENFAWLDKLRYEKSFTAKLLLSDKSVRDYYELIVGTILSFEKVHSRSSWTGLAFSVGKNPFARVAISGKTLCLYLAAGTEDISSLKYKAIRVDKKKYEKTPSVLKIKSEGAAKFAVKQIEKLASDFSLKKKEDSSSLPFLLKPESFDNLVARGLIRVIKAKSRIEDKIESVVEEPQKEPVEPVEKDTNVEQKVDAELTAYSDTSSVTSSLLSRHAFYGEVLSAFASGETTVKSSEKLVLKALDETWIEKIESALNSIDYLLRNPTHFIAETEEILPIELTRKITGRSVAHLSRHTDFISEVNDDGTVTPTKLLNIFREDSVLTYENKFLNTLISRLYFFVTERFRVIKAKGADEKINETDYETNFFTGEKRGKIKLTVTLSEEATEADAKEAKSLYASPLYERAEKLDAVVRSYAESDFCKQLGRNFIRPPVMRTNAILKNKYFRDCLDLWEFVESYEDFGAGVTVSEKLFEPSQCYINELYGSAAMSFLQFLHEVNGETGSRAQTAEYKIPVFSPKIITEKSDISEDDYNVTQDQFTPAKVDDDEILVNVLSALKAQKVYRELNPFGQSSEPEPAPVTTDEDSLTVGGVRYLKSFEAKLRLSSDDVKSYVVGILNAFASYKKVRISKSFSCITVFFGRKRLAMLSIKGKTLSLYSAFLSEDSPEKYTLFHLKDYSSVKKYAETPSRLKVKSDRAFSYALQIVELLAQKFGLVTASKPSEVFDTSAYSYLDFDTLLSKGLIKKIGEGEPAKFSPFDTSKPDTEKPGATETTTQSTEDSLIVGGVRYLKSFEAKLRLSSDDVKSYVVGILNAFASYKKVRISKSFSCITVFFGRKRLAMLSIKGKTPSLYSAFLSEDSPEKYTLFHLKDYSSVKKYAETPSRLKVKSDRAFSYALQIVELLAQKFGLVTASKPSEVFDTSAYSYLDFDTLLSKGLIKKIGEGEPAKFTSFVATNVDATSETKTAETAETEVEEPEAEVEPVESSTGAIVYKGLEYVKDFEAKIRLADDTTKDYFIQILNAFAVYKNVKIRLSGYFTNIKYEKDRIACINMRGKTLCFFTNVLKSDAPEQYDFYHLTDLSDKKKYVRTPSLLKIKGSRTLKYALSLVDILAQKYGLVKAKKVKKLYFASDFPFASFDELLSLGLIHKLKDKSPVEEQTVPNEDITQELTTVDTTEPKRDDLKSFEFGFKSDPYAPAPQAEIMPPKPSFDAEKGIVGQGAKEVAFESESKNLPGISYPESMDYSRPTLKGVDDAKGFIADESSTEEEKSNALSSEAKAENSQKKGIFGWLKRIFKGKDKQ